MQRNNEHHDDDLIDLGAASEETKGGQFVILDSQNSRSLTGGISDD